MFHYKFLHAVDEIDYNSFAVIAIFYYRCYLIFIDWLIIEFIFRPSTIHETRRIKLEARKWSGIISKHLSMQKNFWANVWWSFPVTTNLGNATGWSGSAKPHSGFNQELACDPFTIGMTSGTAKHLVIVNDPINTFLFFFFLKNCPWKFVNDWKGLKNGRKNRERYEGL